MKNFKDYIDKNTRIVLKHYYKASNTVFMLQRKRWYGWKNITYVYPSQMINLTYQQIKDRLISDEKFNFENSEKGIGYKIISNTMNNKQKPKTSLERS